MSDVFGQLPGVLATGRAQHSMDVVTHPATRLETPEAVADTQEQLLKLVIPDLNCMLVNHARSLPGLLPPSARLPTIEGWHEERGLVPATSPLTHPDRP